MKTPHKITRAEAEKAMATFRRASHQITSLRVQMESRLATVNVLFGRRLAGPQAELNAAAELLDAWAGENPGEFVDQRSIELAGGRVGYRLGNPALATVGGKPWKDVLQTLERCAPELLRVVKELDKPKMSQLAKASPNEARVLGFQITQEERFFVEPTKAKT